MKACPTFVAALIVAAVKKFCVETREQKARAIVKYYLFDTAYVQTKARKPIIDMVNKELKTSWSLSAIRDAHPSHLEGLKLPIKAEVLPQDEEGYSFIGKVTLGKDPDDQAVTTTDKHGSLTFRSNSEVVASSNEPSDNQANWPDEVAAQNKPAVNESNTRNEESNMSKVNTVTRTSSLEEIAAHYKEHKKAIKALADDLVEYIEDDKKRAKVIAKWLKSDDDRAAAFEKFTKLLDDKYKDGDVVISLFIRLGDNPKKELKSLEKALEAKKDNSSSANSGSTNTAMSFAAGAVIGGVGNILLNGLTPGAAAGTVVAAGAGYYLGSVLDDKGETAGFDQRPGAVLVGGVMGYFGASAGRMVEAFAVEKYMDFIGEGTGGDTADSVQIVINNNSNSDLAESTQNRLQALGLI